MPVRNGSGVSIREKARTAKQPDGGLISPNTFKVLKFSDALGDEIRTGNIDILMSMVRDMSAIELGFRVDQVFRNAMRGAVILDKEHVKGKDERTNKQILMSHLMEIHGLDNASIEHGWYATVYEIVYDRGNLKFKSSPTKDDVEAVRRLSDRCISFFKKFGPVVYEGFDFGEGYTDVVSSGIGDFLTATSIIDLRFTTGVMSAQYILKLLMMYVMGKHSKKSAFTKVNKIGSFNPITGEYIFITSDRISEDVVKYVETQILMYKQRDAENKVG